MNPNYYNYFCQHNHKKKYLSPTKREKKSLHIFQEENKTKLHTLLQI